MAFKFKPKDPVPQGIRRIVQEEIESATQLLRTEAEGQRDEAVHDARKSLKKVRGVLRMIRPELGRMYREENAHFRNVGRRLSQLRDAAALLEIFDQLAQKFAGELDAENISVVRHGLEAEKNKIDGHLNTQKVIERAAATLESAAKRIDDWPLNDDGFKAIAPGLEATYRAGRKALKRAEKRGTDVAFHDLRKRVKDHWYHVRLLENIWNQETKDREAKADKLGVWLGDDHNIAVLREKLQEQPANYGGKSTAEAFLTIAARHQKELRAEAVTLSHELYDEKPRAFIQSLSGLWQSIDQQPEKTAAVKAKRSSARKRVSSAPATKKSRTAAA